MCSDQCRLCDGDLCPIRWVVWSLCDLFMVRVKPYTLCVKPYDTCVLYQEDPVYALGSNKMDKSPVRFIFGIRKLQRPRLAKAFHTPSHARAGGWRAGTHTHRFTQ